MTIQECDDIEKLRSVCLELLLTNDQLLGMLSAYMSEPYIEIIKTSQEKRISEVLGD
jgi:hypothetical protein